MLWATFLKDPDILLVCVAGGWTSCSSLHVQGDKLGLVVVLGVKNLRNQAQNWVKNASLLGWLLLECSSFEGNDLGSWGHGGLGLLDGLSVILVVININKFADQSKSCLGGSNLVSLLSSK